MSNNWNWFLRPDATDLRCDIGDRICGWETAGPEGVHSLPNRVANQSTNRSRVF